MFNNIKQLVLVPSKISWEHCQLYCVFMSQKAYVIHWVRLDRFSSVEDAYQDGKKRLDRLLSTVHNVDV